MNVRTRSQRRHSDHIASGLRCRHGLWRRFHLVIIRISSCLGAVASHAQTSSDGASVRRLGSWQQLAASFMEKTL